MDDPGGTGGYIPGFQVQGRGVVEAAAFPDVVAVSTDQVRVGLPVGLGMHYEHVFAHVGGKSAVSL